MKTLSAIMLSALLACVGLGQSAFAAEADVADKPVAVESAVKADKSEVKKLRGKLLYRRNQIRKLERAAMSADADLAAAVQGLEERRRESLAGAEPKLKELYALEKELQGQIDSMSAK